MTQNVHYERPAPDSPRIDEIKHCILSGRNYTTDHNSFQLIGWGAIYLTLQTEQNKI